MFFRKKFSGEFKFLLFVIALTWITTICYAKNPTEFSVMTFNIENGGTQVDFNKVVEAVKKSGADVVGIQEAWGNTARLAKALHWKYADVSQHIVSRYPLWVPENAEHHYVFVEIAPGKIVAMANIHLPDELYGSHEIKQGVSIAKVLANEKNVRVPMAQMVANKLSALLKEGIPVFLTGDFNSPSHIDWTQRIIKVKWPVTSMLAELGLTDSFRVIYRDAVKIPGYTWPAGRPIMRYTYDGFNPSASDLPERLDFIFSGGNAHVIESYIIGESDVSPWPSDHRAVVSKFIVTSVRLPKLNYIKLENHLGQPSITVSQKIIQKDKAIQIFWKNAPGNRYDYIRIAPVGSNKLAWGEAVRLYTYAKINGSIQYGSHNVKGNWTAWNKGEEGRWPMIPGKYKVELMLDDSNTILAATQIIIK